MKANKTALVVGYGHMGGFHAKVLRDFGYEVTTVDPDPRRRPDFVHFWSDLRGAWDVAAVACPLDGLAENATRLAGTRRLLVEKPFASSHHIGQRVANQLKVGGGSTCVGFVERFNPAVRRLREQIAGREVLSARFVRWTDKPCASWRLGDAFPPVVDLDLKIHDVDLAAHLGVLDVATFDTIADVGIQCRRIEVQTTTGLVAADLMAHDTSPLHALWHTFLMGGDVPTPADAIAALRYLNP